jgi:hypothetical protein
MKNLFILIFFPAFISCSPLLLKAQAPAWVWAKGSISPSGTSQAMGSSITTDRNGNTYITGYLETPTIVFGLDTLYLANGGFDDLFLVKFDPAGHILWSKSPGGTENMAGGYCVKTDRWGNVYMTGFFGNSGIILGHDTLINDSAGTDMFLVKYDSSGNELWARCAQGSIGGGYSVDIDSFGNAYVTGEFSDANIGFGSFLLNNDTTGGYSSVFLVKYDSAGNVVWAKTPHGYRGAFWFVAVGHAGELYFAGVYSSSEISFGGYTLVNDSAGTGDIALYKLDSAGNVIWAKTLGGKLNEYLNSIACDEKGDVYLAGEFTSDSVNFGKTTLINYTPGTYDANLFLARFDSSGNNKWAKGALGTDNSAVSVAVDGAGNPYICATYYTTSLVLGTDTLQNDGWFVARYDTSGNVKWVKSNETITQPGGIALDGAGNIFVTGGFGNTLVLGKDTLLGSPGSGSKVFVAKLSNSDLGISPVYEGLPNMAVYPVPNNGEMNIALSGNGYSSLFISDAQGRKVFSKELNPGNSDAVLKINTGNLPAGIYMVEALKNGQLVAKKIRVQ